MNSCHLQARSAEVFRRSSSTRRKSPRHIAGSAVMALLLASSVVFAVFAGLTATREASVHSWVAVSVPAGGTLWDLAESHTVPGLDTPAVVQLIEDQNALASSTIYEGQTILVPDEADAPAVIDSGVAVAAR